MVDYNQLSKQMYADAVITVSENISIMGIPFYAEEIRGEETFNRRETNRNKILGGTQHVSRGEYVPRRYSFTSMIYHPTDRPDVYDNLFMEMMSKPVEVISPYMGGKFNAEVIIQRDTEEASPNHFTINVDVEEIPEVNSNIPGESKFVVPTTKKVESNKKDAKTQKQNDDLNTKLGKCKVPFKKNQTNACVKYLQEKLILLGHLNKKNKTGKYDKNTIEAVKKYQKSTNGKLLVDGVFGPYTLKSIIKT